MRTLDAASLDYVSDEPGVVVRYLIWFTAKNRTTGDPESMGLWTGDEDRTYTIDSTPRDYVGAGTVVRIEPFTFRQGTEVRMQTVHLSILTPEVETLIRGYEPRGAGVEIHQVLFSTVTNTKVGTPTLVFDGTIEKSPITIPEQGGEASLELTLASSTRVLTRTLPQSWSHSTLSLRSGDAIARWADLSGDVEVQWGELRAGQLSVAERERRKIERILKAK